MYFVVIYSFNTHTCTCVYKSTSEGFRKQLEYQYVLHSWIASLHNKEMGQF